MKPLHLIEERLRALTFRQAIGLVAGANLFLVALAIILPPDGAERGPAILSILGNFHILALHVPAAVLLIVPLFEFFERHEEATATVRRLSVFSAAGTWAAVLCGIFHAHFNGFEGDAVQLHLWGGIAASAFAGLATLALAQGFRLRLASQIAAILVMSFAAHVGGELVHEEGFPFKPNKAVLAHKEVPPTPVVDNGQKRDDYAQVIAPILEAHCVECHGAKKVKGKLRMDSLEALKKGGSEGSAFVPGDLKKSLMHVRVTLNPSDEEFMPTEGNPLTKEQVQAFALWIEGKPIPDDVAKSALAATKAPKQAPKK
jgi:mono/diheme cytochrome c family protein